MSDTHRLVPLFAGLTLGLASCGSAEPLPSGEPLFSRGSDAELLLAESMAYEQLFAARGPAAAKGVSELRTMRVKTDDLGMAHARVQQLVDGVPVFGGEAIVHLRGDGGLFALTDELVPHVRVDTTPDYAADEAIDLAVEADGGGWDALTDVPTADLWILRHEGADHLTWRVQLHRVDGSPDAAVPVLFIDAHDGSLVWAYDNLQRATCSGATNDYGTVSFDCYSSGGTYYLEDTADLLGTYSWRNGTSSLYYHSSTSSSWTTSTANKNGIETHYGLQASDTYYSSAHGRNGINGSGGPGAISSHGYSFITATNAYSSSYAGAFWDPTSLYLAFGDGDGYYTGPMTSLDIVGHEFTHGVTQYESNLTYSGESGGLNESMSDVFGAMIERSVLGESADTWLIGEDTWTPSVAGDALRYMNDPADDGYAYDYYVAGIGSADVHDSSGVGNLAFYLLSEGGTHPRGKSATVVTGIGADDAADIWYLANTTYLTSSATYSSARTATLNAAAALFGSSSTQYTQVGNAWAAVGVGSSGGTSCTTASYSGTLSSKGSSAYLPSSSGTSVTVSSQTVTLTGPSSADFDLYLQKKSGASWSSVASSTGSTSSESISYSGTSGTYRVRVYSYSGTGSYSASWCK